MSVTNVLLVHPNFPTQLIAVLEALERRDDVRCAAIGTGFYERQGLTYRRYTPVPLALTGDLVIDDLATRIRAAEGAAAAARALQYDGFEPDVIVAHPGWGEALYLKDVFPAARLICYCEYHYLRTGGELDFDPEFPVTSSDILHRIRVRNAITLASLNEAEVCIAPTAWQRSTFPDYLQSKIEVAHEGVDVERLDAEAFQYQAARPSRPILTFVARHLEPHRGFHTFMRALPEILNQHATVAVTIAGHERGGYGAAPGDGRSWTQVLLDELGHDINLSRIVFSGALSYEDYQALIARSSVHVYLTYPFVLSWSALEMASQRKALVGSMTSPVMEFFVDRDNARLADMLQPRSVSNAVLDLLESPSDRSRIGDNARSMIFDRNLTRSHGRRAWLDAVDLKACV